MDLVSISFVLLGFLMVLLLGVVPSWVMKSAAVMVATPFDATA